MRSIVIRGKDKDRVADKVYGELKKFQEDKMVEVVIRDPVRTSRQNRALHLYFRFIAEALNEKNLYLSREILKPSYEVEWTPEMVKELLWKPIQKKLANKRSTKRITTKDIEVIKGALEQALAKLGLVVNFPSVESLIHNVPEYELI